MWIDIFIALLNSGTTMAAINARIKLYNKYGVISNDEKIDIYATLLKEGYFTVADLDLYVSQGFLTEEEKQQILLQADM